MPNPAAVAYEAYRKVMNETEFLLEAYLWPWEYLVSDEKEAWWAVVAALAKMKTKNLDESNS